MISTAMAAVNAAVVPSPSGQPDPERGDRDGDHHRHEHRGDAIGQALHGRLAGLRRGHQAGDLGERGVGADPGGPHDEPAAGVHGGAGDRVPGPTSTGTGLAGQHDCVDRRRALLDHAVGGDLLAGTHDEPVADHQIDDRDPDLDAVAQHGDVLRPEVEQRPQRGTGRALGPGLDVAPGEHEHGDDRGDLEVELLLAGAPLDLRLKVMVMPGMPASPQNRA